MLFSIEEVLEALSEKNRYYAGQAIGKEATTRECLIHYAKAHQASLRNHPQLFPQDRGFGKDATRALV